MTDEMTFTWYSTARDILCKLADSDLDGPGRLHILDNQIGLIAALPPGCLYDSARSQLRILLASVRQMLLAEGALCAQEALRNDCANYEAKARADGREHEIAIKDHETADLRADRSLECTVCGTVAVADVRDEGERARAHTAGQLGLMMPSGATAAVLVATCSDEHTRRLLRAGWRPPTQEEADAWNSREAK